MILAAHQPDLLPYTGFWHKMVHADMFDLAVHDQFQKNGYQRRVTMRESWVGVPARGTLKPILEVETDPEEYRMRLSAAILGKYRGTRYWDSRGDEVLGWVARCRSDLLWQNNVELILAVREFLDIDTPLGIGRPLPVGTDGIVSLVNQYKADVYLSGVGGREYMEMDLMNVPVQWSEHKAVTGDSVLSVIFDYADPMSVIR